MHEQRLFYRCHRACSLCAAGTLHLHLPHKGCGKTVRFFQHFMGRLHIFLCRLFQFIFHCIRGTAAAASQYSRKHRSHQQAFGPSFHRDSSFMPFVPKPKRQQNTTFCYFDCIQNPHSWQVGSLFLQKILRIL